MRRQKCPPSFYVLADHLDAILAACEDLFRLQQEHEPSLVRTCALGRLSQTVMLHLLRAREHAKLVGHADRRLEKEAALFIMATAGLAEAAEELKNPSSRGATQHRHGPRISFDAAGALAAALLDALERYYVLYEDAEPDTRADRSLSALSRLPYLPGHDAPIYPDTLESSSPF
jgi:hypothetical protein